MRLPNKGITFLKYKNEVLKENNLCLMFYIFPWRKYINLHVENTYLFLFLDKLSGLY